MSYEALMEMTNGEAGISTYKIVMPNPITGFALNTVTEAISNESVHVIENSARFSLGNAFSAIRTFGQRSILSNEISYPYWENAARIVEDWLALLLAMAIVFIIFPIYCFVFYTVKIILFTIRCAKQKIRKLIEARDKRKYEEYLEKQKLQL